jgi:hypothetical protein
VLKESDLQYRYSKSALRGDDPRNTGFPDSILLNRGELYEVLPFLNRFVQDTHYVNTSRPFTDADGLKAERLLHNSVPGSLRSREHIRDWLVANWHLH